MSTTDMDVSNERRPSVIERRPSQERRGSVLIEDNLLDRMKDKNGNNKQPSIKAMALVRRRISVWKNPSKSNLSSSSREKFQQQSVKLENTFRQEPYRNQKFSVEKAKEAIEASIKFYLSSQAGYTASKAATMTQLIADDIKKRVKDLGFLRYKLVVHVILGQTSDQDILVASRCVWDMKNDNMATITWRRGDLCATITVFATYYE